MCVHTFELEEQKSCDNTFSLQSAIVSMSLGFEKQCFTHSKGHHEIDCPCLSNNLLLH